MCETEEALAAALARAAADVAANRVVDVAAIAVRCDPGGIVPERLRERIRLAGPTAGHSRPAPARNQAA